MPPSSLRPQFSVSLPDYAVIILIHLMGTDWVNDYIDLGQASGNSGRQERSEPPGASEFSVIFPVVTHGYLADAA